MVDYDGERVRGGWRRVEEVDEYDGDEIECTRRVTLAGEITMVCAIGEA